MSAWTSGAHATGHVYYANGTALYNDTNWIGSFMNAVLDPTSGLTAPQRAAIAITTTRLHVSGEGVLGGGGKWEGQRG